MEPVLIEAFRYNSWANLHLLDVCGNFSDGQLQLTSPGTYGTIAATFQHLVGAERRYLWRLSGGVGRFMVRHKFPGIAVLRKEAAISGDHLIELARRSNGEASVISKWKEGAKRVNVGVLLIQALHHGNDHRTPSAPSSDTMESRTATWTCGLTETRPGPSFQSLRRARLRKCPDPQAAKMRGTSGSGHSSC